MSYHPLRCTFVLGLCTILHAWQVVEKGALISSFKSNTIIDKYLEEQLVEVDENLVKKVCGTPYMISIPYKSDTDLESRAKENGFLFFIRLVVRDVAQGCTPVIYTQFVKFGDKLGKSANKEISFGVSAADILLPSRRKLLPASTWDAITDEVANRLAEVVEADKPFSFNAVGIFEPNWVYWPKAEVETIDHRYTVICVGFAGAFRVQNYNYGLGYATEIAAGVANGLSNWWNKGSTPPQNPDTEKK